MFRIRKGALFSENKPFLIANFPAKGSEYTYTLPFSAAGKQSTSAEQQWALQCDHFDKFYPSDTEFKTYIEFSVPFEQAGSFFVQIVAGQSYSPPNYINVDPVLPIGACSQLSILSVLSRQLGPIDRWSAVLEPVAAQGYNAVHFTPIQEYGVSGSHYSLADQTAIDDYYFEKPTANQNKFEKLAARVKDLRTNLGLLGIVDIVLNHTANNSAWIQSHPESCYSTDEFPRLWPAWLVD